MTFDKYRHHRRSTRLLGYDYTQNGGYFVTICTARRECLFGEIRDDGTMMLNTIGAIVDECWAAIPTHFPLVELDAFVVMPNHIHGLLILFSDPSKSPQVRFGKPAAGSLGMIVGSFKAAVSRKTNGLLQTNTTPLWQRNYHDQVIRNEKMLNAIRIYIEANPANWAFDDDNIGRRNP